MLTQSPHFDSTRVRIVDIVRVTSGEMHVAVYAFGLLNLQIIGPSSLPYTCPALRPY